MFSNVDDAGMVTSVLDQVISLLQWYPLLLQKQIDDRKDSNIG
jgi:hypothetical protein